MSSFALDFVQLIGVVALKVNVNASSSLFFALTVVIPNDATSITTSNAEIILDTFLLFNIIFTLSFNWLHCPPDCTEVKHTHFLRLIIVTEYLVFNSQN